MCDGASLFPSSLAACVWGAGLLWAARRRAPAVSQGDVHALLASHYGVTEAVVTELPSYDDLNFKVVAASAQGELKFVMKFNLADASDLALENAAMEHLGRRPELAPVIPEVVECLPSSSEDDDDLLPSPSGSGRRRRAMFAFRRGRRTYHVRLLSFLPGAMLAHVASRPPTLLEEVGRILGRTDAAFAEGFDPVATAVAKRRRHFWDLRYATDIRDWADEVPCETKRGLLRRAFDGFATHAAPLLAEVGGGEGLRSQVVHNDANDYNIVVSEDGARVCGLIDFGDIVHTTLACNLAICLTYCCFDWATPAETIRAAACVCRGYHEAMPLLAAEVDLLWWLVVGRLCTSLASSAHRSALEPENEYISVSAQPAWALLRLIMGGEEDGGGGGGGAVACSVRHATNTLREACGFPPLL